MSVLVEIPLSTYPEAVFESLGGGERFEIDIARDAMWISQSAYEAHRPDKVEALRSQWRFASMLPVVHGNEIFEARSILAERDDVVVLAFSGVDPVVWRDLITAVALSHTYLDTHKGFQTAFEAAKGWVMEALESRSPLNRPFFITGHSLGGALAVLAAEHCHDAHLSPSAVYAFGMPRVGGSRFRDRYNWKLGNRTYRCVYGDDIIARSPPAILGYRHVGRAVVCEAGHTFQATLPLSDLADDGAPAGRDAQLAAIDLLINAVRPEALTAGLAMPLRFVYRFVPASLRDHFPLSYCAAFGSTRAVVDVVK